MSDNLNSELKTILQDELEKTLPPIKITQEIREQLLKDNIIDPPKYEGEFCNAEELLAAGYRLINSAGGGEKPIAGYYPELDKDYSTKALLTKQDILGIRSVSIPRDFQGDLVDLKNEIYYFLDLASQASHYHEIMEPNSRAARQYRNFIQKLKKEKPIAEKIGGTKLDYDNIEKHVSDSLSQLKADFDSINSVFGVPVQSLLRRSEGSGVIGARSPVIGSDKVFEQEDAYGIRIVSDNSLLPPPGEVRVNSIVAELAGLGISESLDQKDPTQRYITLKEFIALEQRKENDIALPDTLALQRNIMMRIVERLFRRYGFKVDSEWLEAKCSLELHLNGREDIAKDYEIEKRGPTVTKIEQLSTIA